MPTILFLKLEDGATLLRYFKDFPTDHFTRTLVPFDADAKKGSEKLLTYRRIVVFLSGESVLSGGPWGQAVINKWA